MLQIATLLYGPDLVQDAVELGMKDPVLVADFIPGVGAITHDSIAVVDAVQGKFYDAINEHSKAEFDRTMDALTYATGGLARYPMMALRVAARGGMRGLRFFGDAMVASDVASAAVRAAEKAAADAAAKKAAQLAAENTLPGQLERAGLGPIDMAFNLAFGLRAVAAEQEEPAPEEPKPPAPLDHEDRPSHGPLDLTQPQIPHGATPLVVDTRLGDVNVNIGVDLDSLFLTVLHCKCPC